VWGSAILDVAMGVIFGFLAISLFTSAAVEAINSILDMRARSLKTGIMALVNDPSFTGLANELYQHALINPLGPGSSNPTKNAPAYIDKFQFANALLDITGLSAASPAAAAEASGPKAVADLKAQVDAFSAQVANIKDDQMRQLLQGIINRGGGDIESVKLGLANWFDNAMDRLSGAYKRWTQVLTFVIALVIAFVVNLDSIRVATLIWENPAIADKLKWPALDLKEATDPKAAEEAIRKVAEVVDSDLPVGWPPDHYFQVMTQNDGWQGFWTEPPSLLSRSILGWFITAIAALFGAPFWFDTLQSVVRLKGSGPSPAEKANGRAASS